MGRIEEQYSWVWHEFYGVYVEAGYMQHRKIEADHPEIRYLPVVQAGMELLFDYDPPRGYARANWDEKMVHYVRYDQSRYSIKGTTVKADSTAIDAKIRSRFKVPRSFGSKFHESRWWF